MGPPNPAETSAIKCENCKRALKCADCNASVEKSIVKKCFDDYTRCKCANSPKLNSSITTNGLPVQFETINGLLTRGSIRCQSWPKLFELCSKDVAHLSKHRTHDERLRGWRDCCVPLAIELRDKVLQVLLHMTAGTSNVYAADPLPKDEKKTLDSYLSTVQKSPGAGSTGYGPR